MARSTSSGTSFNTSLEAMIYDRGHKRFNTAYPPVESSKLNSPSMQIKACQAPTLKGTVWHRSRLSTTAALREVIRMERGDGQAVARLYM